jgi:hypothetical protein
MTTGEVAVSVVVHAPPERVWAALVRWERQGEWMFATAVRGTAAAVGGRLSARTGVGPLGFTDDMIVTAWEPPVRCDVLHVGRLLRGDGGFRLEDVSGHRTRLVWWERITVPFGPVGRLGWLFAGPLFTGFVRQSLHKFARLVEAGA